MSPYAAAAWRCAVAFGAGATPDLGDLQAAAMWAARLDGCQCHGVHVETWDEAGQLRWDIRGHRADCPWELALLAAYN